MNIWTWIKAVLFYFLEKKKLRLMSGLQSPDASTRYCNVTTQKHLRFWSLIWWWWWWWIWIILLKEFGDSARARKLYIDDESEEEEELEPNPKLGAGDDDGDKGIVSMKIIWTLLIRPWIWWVCKQDIASAPCPIYCHVNQLWCSIMKVKVKRLPESESV